MSPPAARFWDDWQTVAALVIFGGTYFVIAVGKLPGYRLDRAGAALLGAALMVGFGVLPLDAAYRAIDFDTITLLLGVMILVANLKLSGFFRLVNAWIMTRARHPLVLLLAVVLVCGFFSAFLVNDTICLIMTPIVAELVLSLKRNPVPYLLAIPMASNVGSTATITGNPQNMIIGSLSQIPYGSFAAALSPIAAVGLVLTVLLIAAIYRGEFLGRGRFEQPPPRPARYHRPLVVKSVLVAIAMMTLFFAGLPVAGVAIVGGALLLFTRRVKADKVYFEIDWPLLLMFVGLFVVVAGLEHAVLTPEAAIAIGRLHLQSAPVLAALTAVLSNVVSNVPAVLVLKPFVGACRTRSAPGLSSPWPRRSPAISHWSDRWPISSWRSARGDTASPSASGRISRSARRSRF
jgi:Na+/H+ antiporter NhaD/arsenite permease-like protein